MKNIPGILLCILIGILSLNFSNLIPLGSVTISIIIGILVGNSITLHHSFSKGITFSEKKILAIAIALTGINLDYNVILSLGFKTLFIIIFTMIFTILSAIVIGKKFQFNSHLSLLVGIGNAVCGSSAIAAAQGVIKTEEKNVGLSIAVINFLGTIGIFFIPSIGKLLNLSDLSIGILAGNTLQAIGQVSAAGYSISDNSGEIALIVKMCRILMITPIVLSLSLFFSDNSKKSNRPQIPVFILAFIIISILNSFHIFNATIINFVKGISKILLIIAMAGIGLKISLKDIVSGGKQLLVLGFSVWFLQIIFTILIL